MYAIGTLYKANKETLSDSSVVTVNAHKQLIRVLKKLFEDAGWTVIDYIENYKSDYSDEEEGSTYTSNDEIEQRRLFVRNSTSDLYFVFETGSDFSKDAFNIGVWTFPHYDETKDIHNQDYCNIKTIIASNDALEYFICLDASTLYGFLYINNQYSSHFYLGYIESFESRENYPFPVLCATQYNTTGFFRDVPPSSGGYYPYWMNEDTGAEDTHLRYLDGDTTDALNYSVVYTPDIDYQNFYDYDYNFIYWSPYCTGWSNYPKTGEYGLGELFVMAAGAESTQSEVNWHVIPSMVLPGKIKGVYKISGYNVYTKYVVQVGGTEVPVTESSTTAIKQYVDDIIQAGGRAFIVANDLSRIGPQNYVALEMK